MSFVLSTADIVVIVAGLATIAWINWYFFLAERRTEARAERESADSRDRTDR